MVFSGCSGAVVEMCIRDSYRGDRLKSGEHRIRVLQPMYQPSEEVAESEGADALSLINTLTGMRIDINTRRPIIRNNTGGLSG